MNTIQKNLLPISSLIPKYIESILDNKVLIALFDSGGDISFSHEHV